MTLPDTIKIGPVEYAVKKKTDLHTVNTEGKKLYLNGHVSFDDLEIRIAHETPDQQKVCILWHEAVHAMLYHAGQDNDDEPKVLALGYALVQFVRDNPELVKLTLEGTVLQS